jgi:hypothetical protein
MGLTRTSFKKGHSVHKPKGAKSAKTKQWEALGEYIVGECADELSAYLRSLQKSDPDLYFKSVMMLLEYFKPKMARNEVTGDGGGALKTETTLNLKKLTLEQLEAIKDAIEDTDE